MSLFTRTLTALSYLLIAATFAFPAFAQPPVLTIQEPDLGQWIFQGTAGPPVELEVVENTPLEFSWLAEPGQPDATIVGYRYGWDVVDMNDPFDPNWITELQPDVLSAPTQAFASGVHDLNVEVRDDLDGVTWGIVRLQIVPPVAVDASTWTAIKHLYR